MNWVKAKGITTEAQYPYVGVEGTCSQDSGAQKVSGFTMVPTTEDAVKSAVNTQPVSICVDASSWFSYSSGILNDCTFSSLDHAVLLVGYDTTGATPFYIVKNSWDTTWGEQGYIRIAMGTNQCGLANHAITTQV